MATFLQAFKTIYETIIVPPMPAFWSAIKPPGTARAFPNHVAVHLGDRAQDFQADDVRPNNVTLKYGRIRSTFYAVSLEEAEALAGVLRVVALGSPLTIGADTSVWLFEQEYVAGKSRTLRTGPDGDFVFEAATVYEAHFNPT